MRRHMIGPTGYDISNWELVCFFFLSFLLSHVSSFHFSHLMILLLVNLHYSPFWYVLLTDMWVGLVRPALHFQPDMLTNVHFIGIFHPTVISNLLTPDSSQSCLQSITKWGVSWQVLWILQQFFFIKFNILPPVLSQLLSLLHSMLLQAASHIN